MWTGGDKMFVLDMETPEKIGGWSQLGDKS